MPATSLPGSAIAAKRRFQSLALSGSCRVMTWGNPVGNFLVATAPGEARSNATGRSVVEQTRLQQLGQGHAIHNTAWLNLTHDLLCHKCGNTMQMTQWCSIIWICCVQTRPCPSLSLQHIGVKAKNLDLGSPWIAMLRTPRLRIG